MTYGYSDPPDEPQACVSQREYDQLKAENKNLRQALARYGGHDPLCEFRGETCSCGFREAIMGLMGVPESYKEVQ